jgi:hypothetical protein
MPADLPSETAVEHALRLANGAKAQGLIGDYAIAGAFAFIYYCEPFETKDFELLVSLTTTPSGLIDLGPIWEHFVAGGASAEGQFLRVSRLLVDFVPVADALDADALEHAVEIRLGAQATRVLTAEHAVAVAVRTARPQDRLKIERLLTSAPQALDRPRLERILEKHGLLLKWRQMQPSLSDQ